MQSDLSLVSYSLCIDIKYIKENDMYGCFFSQSGNQACLHEA